ncbi:hypothetical protein [Maribacter stanieri]|uniref:hypothetical protein n=1 Tax=Maribacter stanieri TaxID=440514 RepID=UPI00249569C4|nr:hypothetical protein [Maribacter stanieri]
MKKIRTLILPTLFTLLLNTSFLFSQVPSTNTEANAGDKGKQIGQTVKSAIETALPIWGTISKMIWPEGKNKINKQDFDKKVAEAEKKGSAAMKKTFWNEIKPIGRLVDEVKVINRISEPSSLAQMKLSEIKYLLQNESVDWVTIKGKLAELNELFKELKTVKNTEIETHISEAFLATALKKLVRSSTSLLTQYINASQKENANKEADNLLRILEPGHRVTSYYISKLLIDINQLKESANQGMSGSEESLNPSARLKESFPKK